MKWKTKRNLFLVAMLITFPIWGPVGIVSFAWQIILFGWFVGKNEFDKMLKETVAACSPK